MEPVVMLIDRKRFAFLMLFFIVAVAWRIWLIRAFPQHIDGTDAEQYLTLADNLVSGRGYSLWSTDPNDPDVYRSPGYPLFLALPLRD